MLHEQAKKNRQEEQIIEQICQLAENADEEALRDLTRQGICIGVNYGQFSAVNVLAYQAKKEAVKFLISKFNANIESAVYGAARANNREYTCELIVAGEGDLENSAVKGAAFGGHVGFVDSLLASGANINEAAEGAAFGGQQILVEDLISKGADIENLAGYAASGGFKVLAETLIQRGADLEKALDGAAYHGDRAFVEELLEKGVSISESVAGAARSGDIDYTMYLIQRGAGRSEALFNAALGGHVDLVNCLKA